MPWSSSPEKLQVEQWKHKCECRLCFLLHQSVEGRGITEGRWICLWGGKKAPHMQNNAFDYSILKILELCFRRLTQSLKWARISSSRWTSAKPLQFLGRLGRDSCLDMLFLQVQHLSCIFGMQSVLLQRKWKLINQKDKYDTFQGVRG